MLGGDSNRGDLEEILKENNCHWREEDKLPPDSESTNAPCSSKKLLVVF
jgi:hypothetical protein